MSQRASIRAEALPTAGEHFYDGPRAAVQRRRAAAARVRRRRLLVADLGLGALMALIGLILAPGLAIAALGAIVVLAGCGASVAYGRVRARRSRRDSGPRAIDAERGARRGTAR